MSETNFTEGNWIVVPYGDGNQLVICSDDENWRIAFMATAGRSPGAMENIQADANLLAASKDLYLTGQFLFDRLNDFAHSELGAEALREWDGHVEPALARFRGALARARGDSP